MRAQSKVLLERLIAFGVGSSSIARHLRGAVAGEHMARQLARSATSAAANYAEACEAESRADFIHKLKLCAKELRESEVWLQTARGLVRSKAIPALCAECDELIAVVIASVHTASRGHHSTKRQRTEVGSSLPPLDER